MVDTVSRPKLFLASLERDTWTLKLPIKMGYHPIILGVKPIFKGILRVRALLDQGGG